MKRSLTFSAITLLSCFSVQSETVDAIEFYHADFNHYFITATAEEAAILDKGTEIQGWTRTGYTFSVETTPILNTSPVCRFFSTNFNPKSSHFYTANADECEFVKSNKDWKYEGIAFYAFTPNEKGVCDKKDQVYRLYNNGQGGAPNHKFTTSRINLQKMKDDGWLTEGPAGVGMCSSTLPPASPPTAANLKLMEDLAISTTRDRMKSPSAFSVTSVISHYFNIEKRTGNISFEYQAPNSFNVMLRGHASCNIKATNPDYWVNEISYSFTLCYLY